MSIISRIKQARSVLNLTQVQFAKKIAISTGYLAGIELENKKVNQRIIQLIVNEFNINEYWLKTGQGEILTLKIH